MTNATNTLEASAENNTADNRRPDLKTLAIRGVIFNWIGRGCSIIITFFLTPFLVQQLGDERYGLWSIAFSLIGFYALADLGLRGTSTKYIAEKHALGNNDEVNNIIVTTLGLYGLLGGIVLLVVGGLILAFPGFLQTTQVDPATIRIVLALTGLTFAIRLVCQPFAATLAALTRYDLTNTLAVVSQIISAVSMVVVLRLGWGLVGMATATLVVGVLTQTAQYLLVRKTLPELAVTPAYFDRSLLKTLFSFSFSLLLINGARRLMQYSVILFVGILLGPAIVTIYSIAESVVRKASTFSKGLSTVVMPAASRLDASDDRTAILKMSVLVSRLMQVSALFILVVCAVMGRSLIEFWIGDGYGNRVYPLLCILAAANVATMMAGGLPSILTGMGRLRLLRIVIAADSLLGIAASLLLMHIYGVIGAGIGILCVRLFTHSLVLPVTVCTLLNRRWRRFALATSGPAIAAVLPSMVILIIASKNFPPATLPAVLVQVFSAAIVLAVATFLLCLPSEVRGSVMRSLRIRSSNIPFQPTVAVGTQQDLHTKNR